MDSFTEMQALDLHASAVQALDLVNSFARCVDHENRLRAWECLNKLRGRGQGAEEVGVLTAINRLQGDTYTKIECVGVHAPNYIQLCLSLGPRLVTHVGNYCEHNHVWCFGLQREDRIAALRRDRPLLDYLRENYPDDLDSGWDAVVKASATYPFNELSAESTRIAAMCRREVDRIIEPLNNRASGAAGDRATHAIDYRSVRWMGNRYDFSPTQAACVKTMWEHWEDGVPWLGEATILESADANSGRLRDVFQTGKHPAWNTMIVSGPTKGTFGLSDRKPS